MSKKTDTSLISLFTSFAKVGVMTFGGGYAMLPILIREIVEKKKYATEDELMNYFAIGQCTPGIIAVNTATFIGYKRRGVIGGIIATLGLVFPSFVIISILASLILRFQSNIYFIKAFKGIRVAVCSLITLSLAKLAKKSIKSVETFIIAILSIVSELLLKVAPTFVILTALAYALIAFSINKKKGGNK